MGVLVVDDHEVVTWGLRALLTREPWVERCLQATDGADALALAQRYRPGVALVDLALGEESGTELCESLRSTSPATRTLLMSNGESVSLRLIEMAGACGFVSKTWTGDDILAAVRIAGLGMTLTRRPRAESTERLTRREEDVLVRIAMGATNDEIARQLDLSLHTVKQHASAAYRKLSARNRTDAVQRAQRLGLIS